MPNIVTEPLYQGKRLTFPEFVLRCCHGFWGLSDSDWDSPLPEKFRRSNYDREEIQKNNRRITQVTNWSETQANREAEEKYKKKFQEYQKQLKEKSSLAKYYQSFLDKVNAWKIPTPDHKHLKEFMRNNLEEGMKWDCMPPDKPAKQSGSEYREALLRELTRDLKYHLKEWKKDEVYIKKKNEWFRALKKNLQNYNRP